MGDLKAALDGFADLEGVWSGSSLAPVLVAARQMLRLEPPCDYCNGTGGAGVFSHIHEATGEHQGDEPIPCPKCLGSGVGVDEALIEAVVAVIRDTYMNDWQMASAVLAAIRAELAKEEK